MLWGWRGLRHLLWLSIQVMSILLFRNWQSRVVSVFEERKGGNGTRTVLLRSAKGIGDEGVELSAHMVYVIVHRYRSVKVINKPHTYTYFIIFSHCICFLLSFLLFYCISFFLSKLFYSWTCVVRY